MSRTELKMKVIMDTFNDVRGIISSTKMPLGAKPTIPDIWAMSTAIALDNIREESGLLEPEEPGDTTDE